MAQQLALENEEIDIALNLPTTQAAVLQASENLLVYEDPSADLIYLAANLKSSRPAQDQDVQMAIRYALNYPRIRDEIGRGGALTPASFIPLGFTEAITEGIGFDPAQSQELLAKAGYDLNNSEHELRLAFTPTMQDLAEVIAADRGRRANIRLASTETPYADLIAQIADFDLVLLRVSPGYVDAQAYLDLLPGGEIAEAIGWQPDDDILETAREKALQVVDLEMRQGILMDAQQRINEIGPYAFVVQPGRVSATHLDIAYVRHPQGALLLSTAHRSTWRDCCNNPGNRCCKKYHCPCQACKGYDNCK